IGNIPAINSAGPSTNNEAQETSAPNAISRIVQPTTRNTQVARATASVRARSLLEPLPARISVVTKRSRTLPSRARKPRGVSVSGDARDGTPARLRLTAPSTTAAATMNAALSARETYALYENDAP